MKQCTCALALCGLLFALSCQKRTNPTISRDLIQEARQYFQNQHYADPSPDSLRYDRTTLHKTPLWSGAQVQTFSFGEGVVVPIRVTEPLFIKPAALSASEITWLFMYPDTAAGWHIEVITRLVKQIYTTVPTRFLFQGKVRVEDWQGHFLRAYLYAGGAPRLLRHSSIFIRPTLPATPPDASTTEAPIQTDCSETDWYACSSVGDQDLGCAYAYTTEECTASTSGDDGGADPGSPSGGDYASVGGGEGSSGGTAAASTITPDTSVTDNPIVACVWNHLMSSQLTNGLKNVLSAFNDNTIYNVTFTVSAGEDSADGVTSYKGNNTFLITLNGTEADDPNYSRIWLASTFIHEAFHAKLRQRALATFGETAISGWSTPIDDMTLSQLASYFEAESKSQNIWESVEHDWMLDNITQMATTLQDFVETYYKSTYAEAGSALAPYIALMYMGLQNSTFYTEQVIDQGQQTIMEDDWRLLAEGGKCQD